MDMNSVILASTALEIEEATVFLSFLEHNSLSYEKSEYLTAYFSSLEISPLEIISQRPPVAFSSLIHLMEELIPQNDRSINGAFFTPEYIVDYIINDVRPRKNDAVLDPGCGCGAFLIGLVRYFQLEYQKSIKNIVRENIFGVDILSYNIRRAKIVLAIYALMQNESLSEDDFNLVVADSLREGTKLLNRFNCSEGFDAIVGNPPYVKFQDLHDFNRDFLSSSWESINSGTFNLYFAFYELGFKLLAKNGKLGYITPNNYFTSLSGESLRLYFNKNKCVAKIVDFSHNKVFAAQTYTALTFISKSENTYILYDRMNGEANPECFLKNISFSRNDYSYLSAKKWRLLKSDEQQNIRKIESAGLSLGNMFNICVGIATLKDTVYFLEGTKNGRFYIKQHEGKEFKIEEEIARPIYKISDFKTVSDLEANNRKIIFPYTIKNSTATLIPEDKLKAKYPHCYTYLCASREILTSRDKGKVSCNPFYAYGRSQGLTRVMSS